MVVHGMSTALSTTITAIACYVYFGYFFLKLTDVQTNLISAVEQLTGNHFMPRFHIQTETVLHQFADLIRSPQELLGQMKTLRTLIRSWPRRCATRKAPSRIWRPESYPLWWMSIAPRFSRSTKR